MISQYNLHTNNFHNFFVYTNLINLMSTFCSADLTLFDLDTIGTSESIFDVVVTLSDGICRVNETLTFRLLSSNDFDPIFVNESNTFINLTLCENTTVPYTNEQVLSY